MEKIRQSEQEELTRTRVKFFVRDELMYRRWIPWGEDEMEQLVVPVRCRKELLHEDCTCYALCGTLGKREDIAKTTAVLLLARDISGYCSLLLELSNLSEVRG